MVIWLGIIGCCYWYSWIPIPLYCGSIVSNLVWDNCNIGFVLLIFILFPLINWISGFESKTWNFFIIFNLLFYDLYSLYILNCIFLLFIYYEWLVNLLVIILYIFILSYYRIRSAYYLFYFSIFGTITFINSLLVYVLSDWLIISLLFMLAFLIKIPCFPWIYWLPEVHCEVNSCISLFLAGLLLKLGIYIFIKFKFINLYVIQLFILCCIISFIIIGLYIYSNFYIRLFDLKKIIALLSILHLNISFISIYTFILLCLISSFIISISHALSSNSLFLFTGILINKTYSRYWDSLFYINSIFRFLFLFFLLSNLSFPGSFNFVGEILALITISLITSFLSFSFLVSAFFFFIYFFLILNRKLPYQSCYSSLNCIEFFLLSQLIFIIFYIGMYYIFICY